MKHNNGKVALICLQSYKTRGEMVANHVMQKHPEKLNDIMVDITQVRFSNGEAKMQINESVRGKDVYIISDIGNYSCTYKMFGKESLMSPDDHFQDIKRCISAMQGRAERLTVIMPLLYASRQDRRRGQESLDCAIALQELERMGVDNIISFDVHAPHVQNAIPITSFDNIETHYPILEEFIRQEHTNIDKEKMIVIAPDTGATERAVKYADMLGLDVGLTYKRRDYSVIENGKNPVVEVAYLGRDVKDKICIVVDDMIAGGGTVLGVAEELKKRGAKEIIIMATFAFFNDGTEKFEKLHEDGIIKKVYSTNLSYCCVDAKHAPWFTCVDLTPLIARLIVSRNEGKTIMQLLDSKEGLQRLINNLRAKKKK